MAKRKGYQKSIRVKLIELLISILVISALIYVFGYTDSNALKIFTGIAFGLFLFGVIIVRFGSPDEPEPKKEDGVTKLVLLDEEGESVKEWLIQGETSLLIGKSSAQNEVDIDLADAEYAALISKQHAVLNQASGDWFIEDIHSKNGTGIKQPNKRDKSKLEIEQPHKVKAGDIIYIANTRLLLK
ncbi:FHA domain-containing protein [Brevibacillus sp. RS1.1]|uniref:FHA domain-containing protein n=1 Tax=Brevibacillus sp. RS1.1 TaxID=2738982 RepID=UPI00156B11AF|nr:FHA domain-containing protein [Brevibacillus sp. RS1.1]NRR04874.1 FHA domain-containing protein [Brevibacillus sp. RS1.1]